MIHFVLFTYICDFAEIWRPPTSFSRTTPLLHSHKDLADQLDLEAVAIPTPLAVLWCYYYYRLIIVVIIIIAFVQMRCVERSSLSFQSVCLIDELEQEGRPM